MVGWSDTDNKANLSPASLRYAANGVVAELGKNQVIWSASGLGTALSQQLGIGRQLKETVEPLEGIYDEKLLV